MSRAQDIEPFSERHPTTNVAPVRLVPRDLFEAEPQGSDPSLTEMDCEAERYAGVRPLRFGSEASVRVAWDTWLRREVVMKFMPPALALQDSGREEFLREARIMAMLEHPNIVPVYEVGAGIPGAAYFTMKSIRGVSLDEWLVEARRSLASVERLERALDILAAICDAVSYAHGQGIVHRDLKPANVMVDGRGKAYVIDWGSALLLRDRPAPSTPADRPQAVGTLAYMAPEAARGEGDGSDERTDVFGLGAILYEVVTGVPPYASGSPISLWERARSGAYVPVEDTAGGREVPAEVLAIVKRAMAAERAERFQTAAELRAEVKRVRAKLATAGPGSLGTVGDLRLQFFVSSDEESVRILVAAGDVTVDLGVRNHNYLLLTLARCRLRDASAGVHDSDRGWVYPEDTAHDPSMSPPRLNLDVFRIRRQFASAGVCDASQIIERRVRTRGLRIGTERIAVARM